MPIYRFGDMLVDPQKYPWGYNPLEWAIGLNGSATSNVDFGNPSKLKVSGQLSFEADLYAYSLVDTQLFWDNYHHSGGEDSGNFGRVLTTGAIEWAGRNRTGTYRNVKSADGVIQINKWFRFRAYSNGTAWLIDIDGQNVASANHGNMAWTHTTNPFRLGASSMLIDAGHTSWDGAIKNAQVKNGTTVLATWSAQEGSGNVLHDSTDDICGTLNNATWVLK